MKSYKTIQEAQDAATPSHYVALNQDGTYGVFEKDQSGNWVAVCQYAYSVAGIPFPADFYGLVQPSQTQVTPQPPYLPGMPQNNASGVPVASNTTKKKIGKGKIALIIIAAVLVLGGIGSCVNGGKKADTTTGEQNAAQESKAETKKEEPKPVDKSLLKSSLDKFVALDQAAYTPESYAAMASAIQNGQAVYNNDNATQDEVTKANAALSTASNGLKEVFNPANYAAIPYVDLARNPDSYKGQKIVVSGKVLQVSESAKEINLRIATDGGYDDVVFAGYDPKLMSSRILEDDMINLYGTCIGLFTYKSTMGASISLPGVFADQIELQ